MIWLLHLVLSSTTAIISGSFLPQILPGISINLILGVALALAVRSRYLASLIWAIWGGFLLDLQLGSPFYIILLPALVIFIRVINQLSSQFTQWQAVLGEVLISLVIVECLRAWQLDYWNIRAALIWLGIDLGVFYLIYNAMLRVERKRRI